MRKFFALALAVAMVLSLASVSFAANNSTTLLTATDGEKVYKYSGDSNVMQAKTIEYGKAGYIQLLEGGKGVKDYDMIEKLKVKADFEMGEDLVESISIVKKYIKPGASLKFTATDPENAPQGAGTVAVVSNCVAIIDDQLADASVAPASYTITYKDGNGDAQTADSDTSALTSYDLYKTAKLTAYENTAFAEDYYYFIEIKTVKDRVVGDSDIIGTLEFNRKNVKATQADDTIKDEEVDFAFAVWYENNYITNATIGADGAELKWDDIYVLKFDHDDEVEIEFGKTGTNNEGVFTVDISGQSKMVVDFNTKANETIAAANPGVKMFFVNFNGAKFNRTGEFEYEMEDMVAAYQIVDDKLVEIAGLELDSDTATFSTSVLGNYVFAAAELVNPVA